MNKRDLAADLKLLNTVEGQDEQDMLSEVAKHAIERAIAAEEEVERLKEETEEKNKAIEELHERASYYAHVRDNAVKVGYKQAQQLQDALNTLQEIGIICPFEQTRQTLRISSAVGEAIQRIQEGKNSGE
ncbi:hypothetical protein [Paenibacillus apiarius]|uniref:hypothetical protein n=1 Tax=Paenibacillus apiarius TaxID=46240 RepID=UPI003B39FA5A